MDDKFRVSKGEESLAISVATFGVDEHHEVHSAATFHQL